MNNASTVTSNQYLHKEAKTSHQGESKDSKVVYGYSLLDSSVTFSPYNSSKHFICKSSPLVEGNPGTVKKK
jgi:hypothetical protein